MKVARLHATADLRLHDETDPRPGAGEELVRVTAVGLCGSDRHWFSEGGIGDSRLTRPLVLGHEIAGVIDRGPRRGERVAVDPAIPCGVCEICRADLAHLCANLRFAGHGTTDGGLRELMAWPRAQLVPLPDDIDAVQAALLEPLGVAIHALDLGKVRPGMDVAVFGCGPIGLLLVQLLREVGAGHILATDPLAHRRAAAEALGATETRPPVRKRDDIATDAEPLPRVDVAFEVAGDNGAVADAIAAAGPGTRVVLVGIPASDTTAFKASAARRKGLTILLSRRMRAIDLQRAIDMTAAGQVQLGTLITGRHALEQTALAFADLVSYNGLKTVVDMSLKP